MVLLLRYGRDKIVLFWKGFFMSFMFEVWIVFSEGLLNKINL